MDEEQYGTTADYLRAFEAIQAEGITDSHLALLRAHLAAPGHATTWASLATVVGYSNGSSVNLQYGRLAERIAQRLGLSAKPHDPTGEAWWLWVLVRWAEGRDPETGHTVFVLRRPAVEALRRLGWEQPTGFPSPDEVPADSPLIEGAVCRITVNAYERNPEARRQCIVAHGTACCICGFRFGAEYGAEVEGYIHVHHVRPLSEVGSAYAVDPVGDLRPVCPNCHAVLHLGGRCRSIKEVQHLWARQRHAESDARRRE
jgi:5-methylcytosine-specific restriction enzyme A